MLIIVNILSDLYFINIRDLRENAYIHSLGWIQPLVAQSSSRRWKTTKRMDVILHKCYQNLCGNFWNWFHSSLGVRDLSSDHYGSGDREEIHDYPKCFENISLQNIFAKQFFASKSLSSSCHRLQEFEQNSSSETGKKNENPDFRLFWRIFDLFFEIFVLAHDLSLEHWAFYKITSCVFLRIVRDGSKF